MSPTWLQCQCCTEFETHHCFPESQQWPQWVPLMKVWDPKWCAAIPENGEKLIRIFFKKSLTHKCYAFSFEWQWKDGLIFLTCPPSGIWLSQPPHQCTSWPNLGTWVQRTSLSLTAPSPRRQSSSSSFYCIWLGCNWRQNVNTYQQYNLMPIIME